MGCPQFVGPSEGTLHGTCEKQFLTAGLHLPGSKPQYIHCSIFQTKMPFLNLQYSPQKTFTVIIKNHQSGESRSHSSPPGSLTWRMQTLCSVRNIPVLSHQISRNCLEFIFSPPAQNRVSPQLLRFPFASGPNTLLQSAADSKSLGSFVPFVSWNVPQSAMTCWRSSKPLSRSFTSLMLSPEMSPASYREMCR